MPPETNSAYLAPESLEATLEVDLGRKAVSIHTWLGRLALSAAPPVRTPWAQNIWTAPAMHPAPSVKAAADALRAQQRNWANHPALHHRRTALIQARLPPVKAAPLVFPAPAPTAHLGAWTLLEPECLLASPTTSSAFPDGACRFIEDRAGPPSRAYLKLWEALTLLGRHPVPGEFCIDLGAAPGGWTWVIASLGAAVLAIDKAQLDPAVAAMPGVTTAAESAFALPARPIDWLVCDVIAYPARTLALLEAWLPHAANLVCTVKFQGDTDHDAVDRIAALIAPLPGTSLIHLFHNKHELTVLKTSGSGSQAAAAAPP